jgi:hypothetical protein
MAQSFYPNAEDVIRAALTDIGAVDPEDTATLTTSMMADALAAFNYLVTSWQAHGMQVWCQRTIAIPLTEGVGEYTLGPIGADVTTPRPTELSRAWIRRTDGTDTYDSPLTIISSQAYDELAVKTMEGFPTLLYFCPTYDKPGGNSGVGAYATVEIWPLPDATTVADCEVYIVYTRPIEDFSGETDTLDFPQEWYNAVRWNLAYQLCFMYEVPLGKINAIKQLAKDTLELAMSNDTERTSLYVSPAQR